MTDRVRNAPAPNRIVFSTSLHHLLLTAHDVDDGGPRSNQIKLRFADPNQRLEHRVNQSINARQTERQK